MSVFLVIIKIITTPFIDSIFNLMLYNFKNFKFKKKRMSEKTLSQRYKDSDKKLDYLLDFDIKRYIRI
jgi:hypothetical protein